jgi:hypothetical protein
MTTGTLYAALQSIPDHRTKKGQRYPLAAILSIAIAAMLSGSNDLMAIFRWGGGSARRHCRRSVLTRNVNGLPATQLITMFSNRFQPRV